MVIEPNGNVETNSLANLLEFFLNYDDRVAIVRHPNVEELFRWKTAFDAQNGVEAYRFENAEARFAIGVIQAVSENHSEEKLAAWITRVLQALGEAKETNEDIAKAYALNQSGSHVDAAIKIESDAERNFYLTNCWVEALCTAEVRFLGWVYQELYEKPFQPS